MDGSGYGHSHPHGHPHGHPPSHNHPLNTAYPPPPPVPSGQPQPQPPTNAAPGLIHPHSGAPSSYNLPRSYPPPSGGAGLPPPGSMITSPNAPHPAPSATPPVATAPSPSASGASGASQAARPLNVRDALSYLDQVKLQFQDRPEIYNKFLDYMKDFKAQTLDTPTVIHRVSDLFRGHPSLIQGFNTFLPPGYHIDCGVNSGDGAYVQVTTPGGHVVPQASIGVATHHHGPTAGYGSTSGSYYGTSSSGAVYGARGTSGEVPPPPAALNSASGSGTSSQPPRSVSPGGSYRASTGPSAAIMSMSSQQKYSPATHSETGGAPLPSGAEYPPGSAPGNPNLTAQGPHFLENRRAPLEFGHAINYVNKIKTRFINQPELYKQFLEILQNYQRDGKPIHDVFAQVQVLFKDSPDLLEEFKQFLPEASALGSGAGLPTEAPAAVPGVDAGGTPYGAYPPSGVPVHGSPSTAGRSTTSASRMPPVGDFGPGGHVGTGEAYPGGPGPETTESTASKVAGAASALSRKKRGTPAALTATAPTAVKKRPRTQGKRDSLPSQGGPAATYTNGTLESPSQHRTPFSEQELELFASIRRYLGYKSTYNEFLKLLNLFSEEIIDDKLLIERVATFIGGNLDLFDRFKALIGYKEPEDKVPTNEPLVTPRPRLDLSTLKAVGSYRKLPLNETKDRCSGRDDLCWEVLNDGWVSHPTWISEEEGFSTHKKNQAEDTMHRCEEERYDFDLNIDSNLSTIALLEPIAQQLEEMSQEEKLKFKISPGAFGDSQAIYHRMIKKVYGVERGLEILNYLHHNPVTTIPVVLRRLKQKDEEWRKLRRQQNKVWREIEIKSFFRSLDYQSPQLRTNERKHMSTKHYVAEIEKLRRESLEGHGVAAGWSQGSKAGKFHGRPFAPPLGSPETTAHAYPPSYHLEFSLEDNTLVRETTQLILSYYDKMQAAHQPDRSVLEQFFTTFLEPFLDVQVDNSTLPNTVSDTEPTQSSAMESDDAPVKQEAGQAENAGANRRTNTAARESVPSSNQSDKGSTHTWIQTQPINRQVPVEEDHPAVVPTTTTSTMLRPGSSVEPRWNTFYGNTPFYVFFRHFHTIYNRLLQVKQAQKICSRWTVHDRSGQTPAGKLGLLYRPEVLADVDLDKVSYFQVFLNLADRLFDGELDNASYEEAIRFLFRTYAHNVLTVDKVLQILTKHLVSLLTDSKTTELLEVYNDMKDKSMALVRQQILYRMKVEAVIGTDEHLYRIEFLPPPLQRVCTVQLLFKDDFTLSHAVTSEEKWAYYVDSFVLLAPTEGVSFQGYYPFLRRNLPRLAPSESEAPSIISHSGLEIKISLNTYRICFVTHSEDFFMKTTRPVEMSRLRSNQPALAAAPKQDAMEVDGTAAVSESAEATDTTTASPSPSSLTNTLARFNRQRTAKWHEWLEKNSPSGLNGQEAVSGQ
ncbi:hypothetical protein IWQ62_002167 [Dispira parvispora]|uniref:Histone deacetylase interacting domain-containing protein n=1 Tax=Dispira parvispora TaxID=1520584 RepID=A0A9W8AWN2_9FUNG|nr:hypothetical protein IWQ62_002167 [Dispira parvispora]